MDSKGVYDQPKNDTMEAVPQELQKVDGVAPYTQQQQPVSTQQQVRPVMVDQTVGDIGFGNEDDFFGGGGAEKTSGNDEVVLVKQEINKGVEKVNELGFDDDDFFNGDDNAVVTVQPKDQVILSEKKSTKKDANCEVEETHSQLKATDTEKCDLCNEMMWNDKCGYCNKMMCLKCKASEPSSTELTYPKKCQSCDKKITEIDKFTNKYECLLITFHVIMLILGSVFVAGVTIICPVIGAIVGFICAKKLAEAGNVGQHLAETNKGFIKMHIVIFVIYLIGGVGVGVGVGLTVVLPLALVYG